MWQLYAYTAFDIVRERQREAREAALRGRRDIDPGESPTAGAGRRLAARALVGAGRGIAALAGVFVALAARVDGTIARA